MNAQGKPLTKPQAKRDLKAWLESDQFKRELGALLPKTLSPERFVRIAFQALHRNPDLLKTTQESFFNCLLQLGAMGLEPDGRRAHLIPFGTECTLLVDYKGIAELLRRNGDVTAMHSDVVGEHDEFEVRFGSRGILDHKPNLAGRGRIICAYSWVRLPGGHEEYDVMTLEEIEAVRKRSRSANKGPWVTDWNEMAKKTVFRRHSKTLPLSPETRDALERDNDADSLTEKERFSTATPAKARVMEKRPLGPIMPRSIAPEPANEEGASNSEITVEEDQQPTGENLQIQVAARLAESGYSAAELLELMKPLKLAPKAAQSLSDVADQYLLMVLEDWDDCERRLKEARDGITQQ